MKNRVSGRYFLSYRRSKEKKAKLIKQSQKEHPAGASTLKKLRENQGKIGVPPLKANMLGLHEAILRCKVRCLTQDKKKAYQRTTDIFLFVLNFFSIVIVAFHVKAEFIKKPKFHHIGLLCFLYLRTY